MEELLPAESAIRIRDWAFQSEFYNFPGTLLMIQTVSTARNPSCSKCLSLVRSSVRPSRRIVCMEGKNKRGIKDILTERLRTADDDVKTARDARVVIAEFTQEAQR